MNFGRVVYFDHFHIHILTSFYVARSLAVNDALFHVPNFFIFYNLGRSSSLSLSLSPFPPHPPPLSVYLSI